MRTRALGKSGIEISALGMGCWTISGPFRFETWEAGWGPVDDTESIAAIRAAIAAGVTFFDTAANYGAGHSERLLGRAVADHRSRVVIATKFGYGVDEARRVVSGVDASPAAIRASCEASLRRLGTDYIDLFQFHVGNYPFEQVGEVLDTLEALVAEGRIRAYGWSTDDPERALSLAAGRHCASAQHTLNVLQDQPRMLQVCDEADLASINRAPLAMGLLTGKYRPGATFAATDVRHNTLPWMLYFQAGQPNANWLERLDAIREVLCSGGRTLTQGALAWIWGRSPRTIPIPGFRTVKQVEENAGALALGPLTADEMADVERILGRERDEVTSSAGRPTLR
jgi:aryl-alcohol dehydrogenase-like predicted oxidoreductase